jgi:2-polyprenyl-3-methyl-5-hydroxy-6-metoxy-1,4-benzoquinol methylase
MQYDPIKRSLGNVFNKSPFLRKVFYNLLDLLLLRSWHIHKQLKGWEKELKTKSPSILDAGAGFGQYTYWMGNRNSAATILAVDVKTEQVEDCNNFVQAIGFKNVKFQVADLLEFKKANSYDLVLSVDVMEHILEDTLVFRNFHESLKPGGMLLISTPSDQGGSDAHDEDDASFIEEHVRNGYNVKEIEDKLRSSGFSKVDVKYSYGTSGQIAWRFSMKYPILALGYTKLFFIVLPFYYLLFYPICFVLNYLDTNITHKTGTGLIVKAWK